MFTYRRHRHTLTPEDVKLSIRALERGELVVQPAPNPRHPASKPPRAHAKRGSISKLHTGKSRSHSFHGPWTPKRGSFTANGIPRNVPFPASQAPGAIQSTQYPAFVQWSATHTTGIPQYAGHPQYTGNPYQGPVYIPTGSTSVFGTAPRTSGGTVPAWAAAKENSPHPSNSIYGYGPSSLVVGGGVNSQRGLITVGKGLSAPPPTPTNNTTRQGVPHRQLQLHHGHQQDTTKNHPHLPTVPLPFHFKPPVLPVYNPPSASETSPLPAQNQPTMGMVRSYGISWTPNINGAEVVPAQTAASVPVEPPLPLVAKEDSDDSCDSLFKNTPVFPDGSQETSSPSIPQTSCPNTLPSKNANTNTPPKTNTALERKRETVPQGPDTIGYTELVLKSSVAAPMSAANKNKPNASESLRPIEPSHHKALKNDKVTQKEPLATRSTSREQTNNRSQTSQPKQDQKPSGTKLGSSEPAKIQKTVERAGHVKNSNSFGKKGKKSKHSKSGSVNSTKMLKGDMSNFSLQGKQRQPEPSHEIKSSKGKTALEEARPPPCNLNPENPSTSTSRRRRNLSISTMAALPQQNGFLQENLTPAPAPATASTTTINSNGAPVPMSTFNKQLLNLSPTYNQLRMIEKSAPSVPTALMQRGNYEALNTYAYQPERATLKPEPRQFYPPPPVQPIQKAYPMQPPPVLHHQVGQSQVPYNQKSQYTSIRPQIPQLQQAHHQNYQNHQSYHQNYHNQQSQHAHHQNQLNGFHQNYSNSVRRGPEPNSGYTVPQNYSQHRMQQYPNGNFAYQQPQVQQKPVPPPFQRTTSHTAPPTPHRSNRYVANVANQNLHGGVPFNRFATGQTSNGNPRNTIPGFNRGHVRNRSNQSQLDYGGNSAKPTILQAARYKPRTPSPPPIVKLSVRNRKLLWPIGPFIPLNRMTCSPSELDSSTFVNVFCTTVGILRLPFSVEFLRMLKSVLPPKHGDHIITFPSILADPSDMTPYWERCYYCQQFLFKYAKHLGFKPFEELPMSDWPRVEIMLGTDNTKKSRFNIYLSQPDDKRLLFRCVEQKLNDEDKGPKATFFVTVHQTGVNQVQYSDPYLQDDKIPLPPLDGSRDPRTTPEFQYNLPHYLGLNESRSIVSCGFTGIGIPAKRLNFHPFGPKNFDSLWYGMAHLQELVIADDNISVAVASRWNPDRVFGIPNVVKYCKKRTEVMRGNGEPKFAEHDEVLKMNCKAARPPSPQKPTSESTGDESQWGSESLEMRSPGGDAKSTSAHRS
ncbi:hypothetical protein TWF281_008874 [Arthrobotrys megalospora]